ncbi:uncharacterized protein DUF3877 [Mobilisporobacter senegalensis]|uniref:Uncharacterized protein DUF3877 n=1 Tax=Mobilisporobacter senegalensis TaxID=1329262 RepID=A0A3N1XPR5_9FIRM|nr:DUF3877 family protein [Mobilisporobacter senegalensis]ROR28161.1 uncharacterized protein DUF3877 [Mobilisporobacter senegalensis]
MEDKKIQGFLHLERNLEAMIYEGIVKIGYVKGEKQSIYYDYDLLVYLLNIEQEQENIKMDIMPRLREFQTFVLKNWGKIGIEIENHRYKFNLPGGTIDHIYEKNKDNLFLSDLIGALSVKDCTLDNIMSVFYKYSQDIVCEESKNPEFNYVIYFKDTNIDEFKYCFTFGEMGKYYHRLTPFDYERLD